MFLEEEPKKGAEETNCFGKGARLVLLKKSPDCETLMTKDRLTTEDITLNKARYVHCSKISILKLVIILHGLTHDFFMLSIGSIMQWAFGRKVSIHIYTNTFISRLK